METRSELNLLGKQFAQPALILIIIRLESLHAKYAVIKLQTHNKYVKNVKVKASIIIKIIVVLVATNTLLEKLYNKQ